MNTTQHLLNSGQKTEVRRATADQVHERIAFYIQKKEELDRDRVTSLEERLQIRQEENEKEAEEKRQKRRDDAEKKRREREDAAKVKTEYGEDVRIEGEHEEDDMMAQMGFTGFGTSKK